jgi:hypothetical protein
VARLLPVQPTSHTPTPGQDLLERMREQRAGRRLGMDWRVLRDEGRKG